MARSSTKTPPFATQRLMEMQLMDARKVAERVERVQERIGRACARAGRAADEVTLVAVSKTFPVAAVDAARAAGLQHFGENQVQDLVEKAAYRPGYQQGGNLHWHMIGHLQRNKAQEIVETTDLFHALDSARLAEELNKRAEQAGRVMPCLVQVNVAEEESKYGLPSEKTHAFLDSLASFGYLHVLGLMTLAPYTDEPETVRPVFEALRRLAETYDAGGNPHVEMKHLSMGMSGDFEVAIEEGATHVRIGSAIFGARDY